MKARSESPGTAVIAYSMLAAAAFSTVSVLVCFGDVFQNLELMVYDRMLRNRPVVHHRPPITLITLSDDDLARLQHCSIPDAALAGLLDNLIKHHPRAIGVDLYRDIPLAPGTDHLAAVLNQYDEIIVAQQYGDNGSTGIPPPPYLNEPDRAGCTDFPEDSDKHIRRALIYLGDDSVCYTFGYLLALRYLAPEGITALGEAEDPHSLRLGKSRLPYLLPNDGGYRNMDNRGYGILLDFKISAGAFRSYSLSDALDNRIATADITGKIVLIGSVSKSGKDFLSIPDLSEDSTGQKTAGINVHGLFADQLIRAALDGYQPLQTISEELEWLWVGICCAAGVLIGSRKQPLPIFVLLQALGLGIDAAAVYWLFRAGIWIPLIPSALGWLFSTTFTSAWLAHREYRQRNALMSLFARHVSSPIAAEIWRHRADILQGGTIAPQRMTATVFFSDLAGFTHIAESLAPEIFITWLNEYLDAMTSVINDHGGVVIRFIGDAIMAGFGVPIPRTNDRGVGSDANRAACCALAIQDKLIVLNKNWASRGLPTVEMRIGLNTGPLLAGSLGNRERLEYTIHGDTVNTAARLEGYQKDSLTADYFSAPCRILISSATEQHLSPVFTRTSCGHIELRGKEIDMEIFCLLSLNPNKQGEGIPFIG